MQLIDQLKAESKIKVIDYVIIKDFTDYSLFISDILAIGGSLEKLLACELFPDFDTYRTWKKGYHPWVLGEIDESCECYKPSFYLDSLPMNKLYERVRSWSTK